MPSFSNIESYQRLNGQDYATVLHKFRCLLEAIGLWNATVAVGFEGFKMEVDDWGQISYELPIIGAFPTNGFEDNIESVPITPVISVHGGNAANDEMEIWLGCGFWIESALLEDYPNYRFAPHTFQFIPALMQAMAKEIPDHPIYLTNELSDGKPREFIVGKRQSAKWEFDYALIPQPYYLEFNAPPSTHTASLKCDILEISDVRYWRPY